MIYRWLLTGNIPEANGTSKHNAVREVDMLLLLASLFLLLAVEYADTAYPGQTSFCNNYLYFCNFLLIAASTTQQPEHLQRWTVSKQ